jgi:hypothetical protein
MFAMSKTTNQRRSTVPSHPLQLGFPAGKEVNRNNKRTILLHDGSSHHRKTIIVQNPDLVGAIEKRKHK